MSEFYRPPGIDELDPMGQAEAVLRAILLSQPHVSDVIIDSPPGAGKTGVAERLAIQSSALHGERCMVSTQTNGQAFDLARRLARGWPKLPVHLFTRKDLFIPAEMRALKNLQVIHSDSEFPEESGVVISNSAKWSYVDSEVRFNLLIVDEAYQLRDANFAQIAGFADRRVLIGDPGQINPVTSAEIERWQTDPTGPHVPSPLALLARRGAGVLRLALPVSRRLPEDTVRYVRPAFYPHMDFTATSGADERRLMPGKAGDGRPEDALIDLAATGASLVMGEMPPKTTGEFDSELSQRMVDLIARLVERETVIGDYDGEHRLTAEMIGVVAGHRSQVHAVQERLPDELKGVYVETSDRYQGLERKVMLVHHPLSGRSDVGAFHLDAGRLCVMASRHRISCFLVARQGIRDRLGGFASSGERVLGVAEDEQHNGRSAHRMLLEGLAQDGRILPL